MKLIQNKKFFYIGFKNQTNLKKDVNLRMSEQITEEIKPNTQIEQPKKKLLISLVGLCPNCKKKAILQAKLNKRFKMGECPNCHKKTYFKLIGRVKVTGRKNSFKIIFFNSIFADFWLNIVKSD